MNCTSDLDSAMRDPGFYPHPVQDIRVMETHISRVFLTGSYAYKIKKPVDLGFLNFTTLNKRRHFCRRELVLNRRLAPSVYLDVLPVTAHAGRFLLDGPGQAVEYTVKMKQLPEKASMKALLDAGSMTDARIQDLAALRLAEFHRPSPPLAAPRRRDQIRGSGPYPPYLG